MQAILILAHRDFEHVNALVDSLCRNFNIYIHFDKKFKITDTQRRLLDSKNVHYIQTVSVNWGSWSIGEAMLKLLKMALLNKENTFFHFISGQDFPIMDSRIIYEYFDQSKSIFLLYKDASQEVKSGERLIWWQQFYYNYDRINRRSFFGKIYHRINLNVQRLLRINKFSKFNINLTIYSGPNWCDLPRYAAEYCVDYIEKNPNYYQLLKTSFCPDEFWIPTILCNSEYKENIIQNYHRYIDWSNKNGSYPAILDETDYSDMVQSNNFFARKLDSQYSVKLITMLKKNWEIENKNGD